MSRLPLVPAALPEAGHRVTATVFDAASAPIFTMPSSRHFPRSHPYFRTLWDGTDPLLGGHGAAPCRWYNVHRARAGGAL
jgi:hypothetical protein